MANKIDVDLVRTQWLDLNANDKITSATRQSVKLDSLQKLATELAREQGQEETVVSVWDYFESQHLNKRPNAVGDLLNKLQMYIPGISSQLSKLVDVVDNTFRRS